jgi:hypothetical protein
MSRFKPSRISGFLSLILVSILFQPVAPAVAVQTQQAECVIGTSACPAMSAQEIYNLYGTTTDGTQYLKTTTGSTQAHVLMNRTNSDNGAWVLMMKATQQSANFGYSSSYFTSSSNVLNETSLTNDFTTDAKFDAYNKLSIKKILAVFSNPVNGGAMSASGDIQSNAFGGHVWLETLPSNATAQATLTTTRTISGDAWTSIREPLYKTTTSGTVVFGYENVSGRYGFSISPCAGGVPNARWGINWNENNPTGDFGSCDTWVGIGLNGAGGAGDISGWNGTGYFAPPSAPTGRGKFAFQIWGKSPEPAFTTPQNLTTNSPVAGTVNLSWNAPASGTVDEYVVQYKLTSESSWATGKTYRITSPGSTATASLTGLTASSAYQFRVWARSTTDSSATPLAASVENAKPNPTLALTYPNSNTASFALNGTVDPATSTNSGDGTLSFGTNSAACSVNSTTGRITILKLGECVVNETSTATANFNLATFSRTVTITAPASSDTDSALVLNGSTQYATSPSNSAFDITGNISAEAWVYPTTISGIRTVVGKWGAYMLQIKGGNWHYWLWGTSAWLGVDTGIPAVANEWHHVAFTKTSGENSVRFYVDGRLAYTGLADGVGTGSIATAASAFTVGSHNSNSDYFAGQIDEVKLWNVVRTQENIQSDLKTYGGTLSSGLVAYYDFNDVFATEIVNRSTNGSAALNLSTVNSPTTSSSAIFTTTTNEPYSIISFKRNYLVANNGWKSPSTNTRIKYLIVGGGGGGGAGFNGGGGGGGGYLESTTSISANTYYPIVVGAGGRGGLKTFGPTNGENSTAFGLNVIGGGRGGTEQTAMSGPYALTNPDGAPGSGGSGGGGNHGATNSGVAGGAGTLGQGFNGGAGYSAADYYVGGGGGGAGGVGGAATTSAPGNGGIGKTSTITFLSVELAGGGGGAGRYPTSNPIWKIGSASFGGGGGAAGIANRGTTNTGGGGGGATEANGGGVSTGGNGGSGLIVVRYLTTSPSINLQPTNDTTTAGLNDSFTVGTTAVSDPFSKSVKWQVATDTVTAAASVSWIDITSGSGSTNGTGFATDTFTTAILTTAMNKFRYRAIVTFSDSDSLTVVETSTVATLTINPAITITSSTSTITQKYGTAGATRTVTYTGGTDTRTVSASATSLAGGKITFNTSTALFTIDTRTAVGTYLDTITVTDAKGATASYVQTITFTVADTLTVTSDTPTALTFTGSEAVFTPTVSVVSGLVSGDVVSGATYNYSATAASCAAGGLCSIGQTGPGGGLVFITPSTSGNTTGRYFEAAPSGWSGTAADPIAALCTSATSVTGASGTAIGTGETNTNLFASSAACGASAADTATALVLGGKDDWFLPSFDELKEMFSKLHKAAGGALGGFNTASNTNYLSTSDNPSGVAPAGVGYALYGWFGSADGVNGWGSTSKTNPFAYRPVRSFVATSTSTVNYGPSQTKPTNAATYTITPSSLTFSDGAAANYANITYRTSTLTINKAAQAALTVVPLYNVFNGNPTSATLLTTGGSDTGTVTYAYVSSLSTAGGCALSGADSSTVTVTTAGTCRIVATKAATNNYLLAVSDTGTVTFYLYVTNIPAPRPAEYPAEIVLSGATAMTNTGLAPTITTTGNDFTASPGATFTIAGSGFVGTRLVRVSGTSAAFTVLSNTSLQITMPTGLVGISGPIYVEKAEGSRVSEDWVTGTA